LPCQPHEGPSDGKARSQRKQLGWKIAQAREFHQECDQAKIKRRIDGYGKRSSINAVIQGFTTGEAPCLVQDLRFGIIPAEIGSERDIAPGKKAKHGDNWNKFADEGPGADKP
jgi:hypothetical protein